MAIDPFAMKPSELVRLMNSTPLGATLNRERAYRLRDRAGLEFGDGTTIDLIRYTVWLFHEWRARRAGS